GAGPPRRNAPPPGRARCREEGERAAGPIGIVMSRLFFPTARQWNVLIALGLFALGYALYLRYIGIEQAWVALSCQDGATTWICISRNAAIVLCKNWVFGALALGAAAVNLIRPSLVLFAIAMVAAAFGVVLYTIGASG